MSASLPAGPRRPLSAVLIARDEEHRLAACLESLSFADEIVLVESGSTDRTVEIARRYTDRVVTLPWRGFGPQKQAAVALARSRGVDYLEARVAQLDETRTEPGAHTTTGVTLQIDGGFAYLPGLARPIALNAAQLGDKHAAQLQQLCESACAVASK